MIDLHNHIINQSSLNAVDWGSVMDTARLAVGEGVEHIVWTPEIYSVNELQKFETFRVLINELQDKLNEHGYPLTLSLGADLHLSNIDEVICKRLKESIDSDYLIVSFTPYLAPNNLKQLINIILSQSLVPIIAHPEQYAWLNDKYSLFYELIEQGSWIQVTSDSLLGMFGHQAEESARRLINDGVVHVVASESHSLDYKPPLMGEARQKVEKIVGSREANNIFHNRGLDLLNNVPSQNISQPSALAEWSKRGVSA